MREKYDNLKLIKNNKQTNKGITLIALVITIIVLLILAGVSISMLTGENGILTQAETAKTQTDEANAKEAVEMEVAGSFDDKGYYSSSIAKTNLEKNLGVTVRDDGDGILRLEYQGYKFRVEVNGKVIKYKTFEEVKNGSYADKNILIEDDYKNTFMLLEDFKVVSNDTTNNADTVNEGIVIEDKKGNQFVWIPVGEVYTDIERTEANKKEIELGRYSFANDGTPSSYTGSFTEDTKTETGKSSYGNAIAKDIETFISKANNNHGYYLGRYEAGVTNYDSTKTVTSNSNMETNWTGYVAQEDKTLELVCKSGQQVWNYVTQNKASELARGMYIGKTYESDLINSYAWDTAIVFIQKCSEDTDYSRQVRLQSTRAKTGEATDGANNDVRCNIYDMAGNTLEWSTETSSHSNYPCVYRGGNYNISLYSTSFRSIYYTPLLTAAVPSVHFYICRAGLCENQNLNIYESSFKI